MEVEDEDDNVVPEALAGTYRESSSVCSNCGCFEDTGVGGRRAVRKGGAAKGCVLTGNTGAT